MKSRGGNEGLIRIVQGNLLKGDINIFAHQVNCQGVMASGVAKQIREKWPVVGTSYRRFVHDHRFRYQDSLLGRNQYVEVINGDKHAVVANLFAQDKFGYDGRCYTSYFALRSCFRMLRYYALFQCPYGNHTGIPYRIGCDRGGANWDIVYKIIQEELNDCNVSISKVQG